MHIEWTESNTSHYLGYRAEFFLRPMILISHEAQENTQSSRVSLLVVTQQRLGLFKCEKTLNGRIARASHLHLQGGMGDTNPFARPMRPRQYIPARLDHNGPLPAPSVVSGQPCVRYESPSEPDGRVSSPDASGTGNVAGEMLTSAALSVWTVA
jgi:hypothetical protein